MPHAVPIATPCRIGWASLGGVGVYVEYCIPQNVSRWYMLKRLAEFEPGYFKRAHSAMVAGDPLANTLMNRAQQTIVVEIESNEYDEEEVEKEVAAPSALEERFHYSLPWGR
eukprot:5975981-Prymnesium_polylepis.1